MTAPTQLSIFEPSAPPKVQVFDPVDDDIVAVYSCARSGGTSRIRLFMTRDEAMALCSEPETAGRAHQSEWILMWTSISNLRRVLGDNMRLRVVDDGRFDSLMDRLGITPISRDDPRVSSLIEDRS